MFCALGGGQRLGQLQPFWVPLSGHSRLHSSRATGGSWGSLLGPPQTPADPKAKTPGGVGDTKLARRRAINSGMCGHGGGPAHLRRKHPPNPQHPDCVWHGLDPGKPWMKKRMKTSMGKGKDMAWCGHSKGSPGTCAAEQVPLHLTDGETEALRGTQSHTTC